MLIPLPQFKDFPNQCQVGGNLCQSVCRSNHPASASWRLAQTGSEEVICPYNLPMGWKPSDGLPVKPKAAPKPTAPLPQSPCARAKATLGNATSVAKAIARGTVDEATQAARQATCATCPHRCEDVEGNFCGLCGCGIGGGAPLRILDLTRYREGEAPNEKLCKHPKRAQGQGWISILPQQP